jgi:hypothetical protein
MGGVFVVAEHFNISPSEILTRWSYPLFVDSLERLAVLNEIEHRRAKLMEQ